MKKILLLLLCVIFALSAFIGCEETEESKGDISENKNESQAESADVSEEASETEESINIIDKRYEQNGCWSEAEDKFFEDDEWIYSFSDTPMSEYVIVEYPDGTTQNIKDAFADGKVTIEDLDRFGIEYYKRSKTTGEPETSNKNDESDKSDLEVIDIVLPSGVYSEAIDLFYSDDEYDYCFPSLTKYAMKVYYSDGSVQSVKEAIDAGNITIADLDKFDIFYLKAPKGTYSEFGR